MCPCFLITSLIFQGPIISTLIWCFLFNCWNKHLILVEVHRNTEAFDFPKKILIKIFRRIFRELKSLLTSNAYVQLTCLNLEENIHSVEVLACLSLLFTCIFVCFLSFVFWVVWDNVNNDKYITDFSINFFFMYHCNGILCFKQKGQSAKSSTFLLDFYFPREKGNSHVTKELYDYFFLNTNAKIQAQICASRSNPF